MMNNSRMIRSLKANLFELTYMIDKYSRKKMMDMLCEEIKHTLNASRVLFYINNKWQLNDQVSHYGSDYPVVFLRPPTSTQGFMMYYNKAKDITLLESNDPQLPKNEATYIIKLSCVDSVCGFMILSFSKKVVHSSGELKNIRIIVSQFLKEMYNKRHYTFLTERNNRLLQLSTKLHSLHNMTNILDEVYQTLHSLYPNFNYYLLMTQEYEHDSFPIKMIEYTGDAVSLPGTIAFMNNELQIKHEEEKNETKIYSPLSGKQGVYGVLQINIQQIVTLLEEEKQFITQLSDMVGRVIERTTLYQSSNKLVSDLQTINIASHDLNVSLDQHDITETVKKHIAQSCSSEQLAIVFFDQDEEIRKIPFDVLKESTSYFSTDEGINFVQYVYNEMKKEPKPILSGNFQKDGVDTPYNSMMIIPMWGFDAVFGAVIIAHTTPYYFSFDKYKFIQTFIQHASLAYTNSVLKEKLKQTSITDYLTKLYSRNHLDKIIDEQMSEEDSGAFILFDIDDFKLVNDTYGHYIGDKVLIQVADILKSEMNNDAIAARWGGEEFAVYLPNCDLTEATMKANVIRERVMNNTDPQVSLSSGVSVWEAGSTDTVERLFIRTDEALYEAKASGKNKVIQNI